MTAATQPTARAAAQPVRAPGAEAAPQRPPLRVVEAGERKPKAARHPKRHRLLIAGSVLLGALLLFGLVAAHVLLTQNQFRLQQVQRQASEEQARYERLRAQVAELESPGRVVAAAQERLGMVPPNTVKYLTPVGVQKPAVATGDGAGAAAGGEQADEQPDEQAMTEWSTVKRRLGSRP